MPIVPHFSSECLKLLNSNENLEWPKFDETLLPPKAEKIPYQLKKHGDIRIDNYYWMKERLNPEVIDYLERENDYYNKMTESSSSLKKDFIPIKYSFLSYVYS